MPRYVFLDNWVFSRLTNDDFARRLSAFIVEHQYSILLTSISMVELYSPGWNDAGQRDRGLKAVRFLANHPCLIVNPNRLFAAEFDSFPKRLARIPPELDLQVIPSPLRSDTLLRFLRRDPLFLEQGKDIEHWSRQYQEIKESWPRDAAAILRNAVVNGTLHRDDRGALVHLDESKEVFLLSLDLRMVDNPSVDGFLDKTARGSRHGRLPRLRAARVVSLCFWHSYVEVDPSDRIARRGSDIGDFYHLSLVPYCSAFTVDGSMARLLRRVARDLDISHCRILTPPDLGRAITPGASQAHQGAA
jgi:hypothetical protein